MPVDHCTPFMGVFCWLLNCLLYTYQIHPWVGLISSCNWPLILCAPKKIILKTGTQCCFSLIFFHPHASKLLLMKCPPSQPNKERLSAFVLNFLQIKLKYHHVAKKVMSNSPGLVDFAVGLSWVTPWQNVYACARLSISDLFFSHTFQSDQSLPRALGFILCAACGSCPVCSASCCSCFWLFFSYWNYFYG